jgi:acetyl esterase/lipase
MSEKQKADLDAQLRVAPLDLLSDLATLRFAFEEIVRQVPVAGDVRTTPLVIGGVDATEVSIDGIDSENTILYFHGGVYVIGSAQATVPLTSDLARRANAKVITVEYRLAPEHPYPAAVEDARSSYEGLISQGLDPNSIALAGESAGGGLVAATLLALRDAGRPLPSSAFVMSPYVDLTLSGTTFLGKQAVDPILTPEGVRLRVPDYVGGAAASDPYISPIFGDLRGLPPMLIQVGSHEILLSDALRLASRAADADVTVTLEVVPGVPHVFQAYAVMVDEADAAMRRAAAFLNANFAVA